MTERKVGLIGQIGPHHQTAVTAMREQLLIVCLEKLADGIDREFEISAAEIDATGDRVLSMRLDPERRTFVFKVEKKADVLQRIVENEQ